MAVKAIIFDMDGVLIDAREWHYEALNQALALFGYEIGRYEHLTGYDGLSTSAKLKRLTAEKGLPAHLHGLINATKQQYTMNMIQEFCRPCFHHEYALSRLNSEGYRLALASNSIRDTINSMMLKANLQQYLEFSLSNQDVTNSKPHPEIYNTAIARLGIEPEECLIVEDNEHGIRAAKDSGGHVLVVKNVDDVNYFNIIKRIKEINNAAAQ